MEPLDNENMSENNIQPLEDEFQNEDEHSANNDNENPISNEIENPSEPVVSQVDLPSLEEIQNKTDAYKAEIERLTAEIKVEKETNAKLQDELNANEQIQKMRNDLELKTTKLQQLQSTNDKQKEAIEQLSKEIKKYTDKATPLQNKKLKLKSNEQNVIDIIIKSKNQELNNLLSLLNCLSKDNNKMKREIELKGDYKNKVELTDRNKLKETKLQKINNEIKYIKQLLEEHEQCIQDKNEYMNQLQEIQFDIATERKNHTELRKQLLLTEEENKAIIKPYLANAKSKKTINENEEKKLLQIKQNVPIGKFIQHTIVPDIVKKYLIQHNNEEYCEDENGNGVQQGLLLVQEIEKIEKLQFDIQRKHKFETREYESEIKKLQEKFEKVNKKLKEKESKNSILKCELNELKKELKVDQSNSQKIYAKYESNLKLLDKYKKELINQENMKNLLFSMLPEDEKEDKLTEEKLQELERHRNEDLNISEENNEKENENGEENENEDDNGEENVNVEENENEENENGEENEDDNEAENVDEEGN